jgi:hypothetical protein
VRTCQKKKIERKKNKKEKKEKINYHKLLFLYEVEQRPREGLVIYLKIQSEMVVELD